MNDLLTTPLPASWLASRLGVDGGELERLRERGELLAARSEDGEWSYPAWQFGPGGKVPAGVREAIAAARSVGLSEHASSVFCADASASSAAAAFSICSSRAVPTPSSLRSAPARLLEPGPRDSPSAVSKGLSLGHVRGTVPEPGLRWSLQPGAESTISEGVS
jgi:hypothetical protein